MNEMLLLKAVLLFTNLAVHNLKNLNPKKKCKLYLWKELQHGPPTLPPPLYYSPASHCHHHLASQHQTSKNRCCSRGRQHPHHCTTFSRLSPTLPFPASTITDPCSPSQFNDLNRVGPSNLTVLH